MAKQQDQGTTRDQRIFNDFQPQVAAPASTKLYQPLYHWNDMDLTHPPFVVSVDE